MLRALTLSVILMLCLVAGTAQAQDNTASEPVVIDVALCRALVSHTPQDDVTYRPGTDMVNGKQVVPADIQANSDVNFLKSQTLEIPLSVDVARRLNLSRPGIEMQAALPPLQLRPDGRVFWQGRDLTTQTVDLCEGYKPPEASGRTPALSVQSPAAPIAPQVTAPDISDAGLSGEAGDKIVQ